MKTTLEIQNLKCGGCAHTIKTKLSEIKAIEQIEIDIEKNKISFEIQDSDCVERVKNSLLKLGYPIAGSDNSLMSKIKSYGSCALGKMNP